MSKKSSPTAPVSPPLLIIVAGEKGGVGKSLTSLAFADAFKLHEKPLSILQVDSQARLGAALVINLLDGRTTPARAACGLPAPFLDLFCLTEKLGQLDRGASIELSPYECALLDQILDAACQHERLGKAPHQSAEVIAAMIKRVAFDNAPPEVWARKLYLGVIGMGGRPNRQYDAKRLSCHDS